MHNNQNFSIYKRNALISEMSNKKLDMLIFGGGITGAGVALDAAARGLKVALIEKSDFASGTSSRSTKLIHGGLRYLAHFQFRFVSMLGRERKIIRRNAQNNVIPTPVLLPIYKNGPYNKWLVRLGLFLYDLLAGVRKKYRAKWIKKADLVNRYNFIETGNLQGALLYYEYKTNDGRLVIETLKKSAEIGALCLNYAEPEALIYEHERISGATIKDALTNKTFPVMAGIVVNATGVWCGSFADKFSTKLPKALYPTKGVHITVSKEQLPLKEAFYTQAGDGRMVFMIPRQNHVYIGTTDTFYNGDFNLPNILNNEIEYLIDAINLNFRDLNISKKDVVSSWSGIRPLLKDKSDKPGEISRKDELFLSNDGLLTITGGKLTGFRLMAKGVVDNALVFLGKKHVKCKTDNICISGSEWPYLLPTEKLVEEADKAFDEAKQTGIQPLQFKGLYYRYGLNISAITEKAYEYFNEIKDAELLWLKAELWYAVNYEMVSNLVDFFVFRTEMVLFDIQSVERYKEKAAEYLAEFLGWTADETRKNLHKFELYSNQYRA